MSFPPPPPGVNMDVSCLNGLTNGVFAIGTRTDSLCIRFKCWMRWFGLELSWARVNQVVISPVSSVTVHICHDRRLDKGGERHVYVLF